MIPNITIPEEQLTYNVTEGGNITCNATGYPPPDILWLNNDGSVVDNNRLLLNNVMTTGISNISSVSLSFTRNDAGIYTCVANNSVGSDHSTIYITVQCKTSQLLLDLFCYIIVYTVPPIGVITALENEEGYVVTEGGNVTCAATGYPRPDIVWLNSDGSVVDKNRLVESTSVANIPIANVSMIVKRNESGVYNCVANNSAGNDTHTVNITVKCKQLASY